MRSGKFDWRVLKTLSNCALVVGTTIWVLDWYNYDQIELVVNDPVAKAYWLQIKHLYDKLELISLVLMIGLRVIYWTIDYLHNRRVTELSKGD